MRIGRLVSVLLIALSPLGFGARSAPAADSAAKAKAAVLSGVVTAPEGKALEGVVVTAGRPSSGLAA